jgi:hypothetical protein
LPTGFNLLIAFYFICNLRQLNLQIIGGVFSFVLNINTITARTHAVKNTLFYISHPTIEYKQSWFWENSALQTSPIVDFANCFCG